MPSRAREQRGDLPCELTSFIGRRAEVRAVKRLLGRSRLVTLTGPGGVGKTRLALRVAATMRRAASDGVRLVELEQVRDEALVPQTVAAVFGLRERHGRSPADLLADHLAGRQVLLVLDNCEHLVAAAARLTETLLRAAPRLRVLATSREPLTTGGEVLLPVPALETPGPERDLPPGELALYEAVSLFVDRARAATPDFALTTENAAAVARVCRRLDGLPLAIELAAARLRVLSPAQIDQRLGDRLALLTTGSSDAPTRSQTLRACIGWSFDLCTPAEQQLWLRSSVFAGGFDLAAVRYVCGGREMPEDLGGLTASLAAKSIVVAEEGAPARYHMLESVREFGLQRLREADAEPRFRRRHRDWYERLVLRSRADWIGPRQVEWLDRLAHAHPEIRAALQFSVVTPGEAASALRICAALHAYWLIGGLAGEGRRWLERAMRATAEATADRLEAAYTATILASMQGDVAAGAALASHAREIADRLGDPRSDAIATIAVGAPATHDGRPAESEPGLRRALVVFRAENDLYWTVMTLAGLAMKQGFAGNPAGAAKEYEELLSITRARGEIRLQSLALWGLGIALWMRSDHDRAAQCMKESLRLRRRMKDTLGTALCLDALAWIAAHHGHAERAARLLGVVAALTRALGSPAATYPNLLVHHDRCAADARSALGDQAFEHAWRHGEKMGLPEAVTYALSDDTAGPVRAARAEGTITPRERQICALVADGLTNKEIAARLVLSRRTVETHVQNVLNKTGFANRELIATWVKQRKLSAHREHTSGGRDGFPPTG